MAMLLKRKNIPERIKVPFLTTEINKKITKSIETTEIDFFVVDPMKTKSPGTNNVIFV